MNFITTAEAGEKCVRIIRALCNVSCGAITGNELVFPIIKVPGKSVAEAKRKAGKSFGIKLLALTAEA